MMKSMAWGVLVYTCLVCKGRGWRVQIFGAPRLQSHVPKPRDAVAETTWDGDILPNYHNLHLPLIRSTRRDTSPVMSLDVPEPSEEVVAAVERAYTQNANAKQLTAADLVAKGGIDLQEARNGLTRLAAALAGDDSVSVAVSDRGDLIYTFPQDVRAALAERSSAAQAQEVLRKARPVLVTTGKVVFGLALFVSIAVIYVAIQALQSERRENRNDRDDFGGGFGGGGFFDLGYWRPWTPYYYGYFEPPPKMSLPEAIFSFVFGDGDPNASLDAARTRAIAEVVRANGGAVVAEELAPYLDPPSTFDPNGESAIVDESWVLPAVQQLEGAPEVTEDGTIVYRFNDLRVSAIASTANLVLADSSLADFDQLTTEQLVATADRLGVRVSAAERENVKGALLQWAKKSAEATIFPDGYLEERPQVFSNAEPGQLLIAGILAAVNAAGCLYLGSLLAGLPPGTVLTGDLGTIAAVFPFLAAFAATFVVVPIVRFVRLGSANAAIEERNETRRSWRKKLRDSVGFLEGGIGKRLRAARGFREKLRIVGEEDIVFDSAKEGSDQVENAAMNDFDRRLRDSSK